MKKVLSLIIIVVAVMSFNVYAAEIPESGVRYVVTSPTGEKYKTFDLEEAKEKEKKEVLIFEGKTDNNGEVKLANIPNNSSIRIVDELTKTEYKKTVGQDDLTVVVKNRVANPKTSQNVIIVCSLLLLIITATLLVKKNKKALPVAILLLSISLIPTVKADSQTIKLVDKNGVSLKNSPVKIYGNSQLSYEEVTITINYDLSKLERRNGNPINRQYTTFLDGSNKKQVIIKWDYHNSEWIPENDNPNLDYIYAIYYNNQWHYTDYCDDEEYNMENSKTYMVYRYDSGIYNSIDNYYLVFTNNEGITETDMFGQESSEWPHHVNISSRFTELPININEINYQDQLEDLEYTLYPYNNNNGRGPCGK